MKKTLTILAATLVLGAASAASATAANAPELKLASNPSMICGRCDEGGALVLRTISVKKAVPAKKVGKQARRHLYR